jgi:hypothetical protein
MVNVVDHPQKRGQFGDDNGVSSYNAWTMPPAAPSREERNVPPMFCRRQPVLSLLTIAAACCLLLAADKPDLADRDVKPFVDRRVEEWQPTADERRFDEIGLSTSVIEAEKLARENARPIFLFTHDGKMNVGRC